MKATFLATCAVLAVAGLGAGAQAAPITYTVNGTFSLNVGGTDYDGVDLTFTGIADTANTTPDLFGPTDLATPLDSFTVSGAPFGNYTFADSFAFFSNQLTQVAGFYNYTTDRDVIDLSSPAFALYDGTTSFPTQSVEFTPIYLPDGPSNTPLGSAYITAASNVTFSAVASAVPEPASWALMIAGIGFAGGAMRRSRTRRTTVTYA